MGVQTANVIMVALGVGTHPSLRPGVHLRWFVDPSLGFPPLGFDVFRRPERSGTWRSLGMFSRQAAASGNTEAIRSSACIRWIWSRSSRLHSRSPN